MYLGAPAAAPPAMLSKSMISFRSATTTITPLTTRLAVPLPDKPGIATRKNDNPRPIKSYKAIAPVAATTPSLNFSVALIKPVRYAMSIAASVANVRPTACITIPGYFVSNTADSPPKAKPSSAAYTGAVTGDHSFLKIVAIATTSPPIAPSPIQGVTTEGSNAVRTWLQTQVAGTTTRNSRNAVLFTVPSSVIGGALGSRRTLLNAVARAGLEGRNHAMGVLSVTSAQINRKANRSMPRAVQLQPRSPRMKSWSTKNFSNTGTPLRLRPNSANSSRRRPRRAT